LQPKNPESVVLAILADFEGEPPESVVPRQQQNMHPDKTLPITVISAGAGSGKTYTLTGRMVDMLAKGVRPAAIMATTFTKKAAAELQERVRARLLEQGQTEAANELGSALIGTVHSIGVKLLQRFAFEAGVSPLVEIIADGDEQRLFNESLAQILTNERTDQMNLLADRLGLSKKRYNSDAYDWRRDIRDLTDVARANNFSQKTLEYSRKRSWETLQVLLPPVTLTDAITLNNRIIAALQQTVAALEANADIDTTKTTKDGIIKLKNIENDLKTRGELYWYEWVQISKVGVGAKSRHLMEDLIEVANLHAESQGFHDDLKALLDLVFEIAENALSEFERYKQKRGLIDYTDMETYVSKLLRQPSVRATLAAELDLLLVDEFQDTSPIQLDIFLQLSQIAKHSIWVGDPKQSIYGFRGAEPALMQAIIEATGGVQPENILDKSWRSRPDLVEAVNSIFVKAFPKMPKEQVVLRPHFTHQNDKAYWAANAPDPLDERLALVHWHLINETDNNKKATKDWMARAVAEQVGVLLAQKPLIFDKSRKKTRFAQPGDIAILCRNNADCEAIAQSLHSAGLKASISRAGLLSTPEIKLILAWLRRLVNPNDRLSAAEIKLIGGETTLEDLLRDIATAPPDAKWQSLEVQPPGNDLQARSATEALDLLIAELDIRRTAAQLGNAAQRLDNIEVLRRYAAEYESACNRLHSAATISGFLLWLGHLADMEKDYQGSGESPDNINVLTYHRSKGLEYPICICYNLDASLKESVWGINLVPDGPPDLDNILGGRWLRFWKNPYGDQIKGTALDNNLQQSTAFAEATLQALAEEARLLYVGLTRARDYLVLPTAHGKDAEWLNRVYTGGNDQATVLDSGASETPFVTDDGRVLHKKTETLYFPAEMGSQWPTQAAIPFFAPSLGKGQFMPYRIAPNEMPPLGIPPFKIKETLHFAPPLTFDENEKDPIQAALTGLFLAYAPDLSALAKHQVQIRQISLKPEQLAQQVIAAQDWLQQRFQPRLVQKNIPLRWQNSDRLLEMRIDWLLDLGNNNHAAVQCLNGHSPHEILSSFYWLSEAWGNIVGGAIDNPLTCLAIDLPKGTVSMLF
jgi:ATP-dependent helicase/nuclease subunit A